MSVQINESVIKVITKILEQLISDPDDRLQQIVDLIQSVCDRRQHFDLEAAKRFVNNHLEKSPNVDLEMQISRLTLKILELQELETNLLVRKDYSGVQALGVELENHIEEFKALIKPILNASREESALALSSSLYRKRRLSNETLIKCVQIFYYMVASENVSHLTPNTVELYKKLICVYFESQETNLRDWVLRSGTSCALLYDSLSKEVFDALWKQFIKTSSTKIWRTTIQCMFELLDRYGFDHFDLEKDNNKNTRGRTLYNNDSQDEDEQDDQENAKSMMNLMSHLGDNCEDATIRAAISHGYCRLILRGHLSSSEVTVKLLLKYFNPATENELSQSLGIFFENLIELRKQELLQQALMPTINAILEAPLESPLSEIDPKKVVRFVVQSTRPVYSPPGLCIHNTLALSFLSTIKDCDEDNNKELIKLLASEMHTLEISDDTALRNDFKTCIDELKEKLRDSKIIKNLVDFKNLMDGKAIINFSSSRTLPAESTTNVDEEDGEIITEAEPDNLPDPQAVFKVIFLNMIFPGLHVTRL